MAAPQVAFEVCCSPLYGLVVWQPASATAVATIPATPMLRIGLSLCSLDCGGGYCRPPDGRGVQARFSCQRTRIRRYPAEKSQGEAVGPHGGAHPALGGRRRLRPSPAHV